MVSSESTTEPMVREVVKEKIVYKDSELAKTVKELDLNSTTPIEAINILFKLKELIKY